MILALGDMYVQAAHLNEGRELLRAAQRRVVTEPGCLAYVVSEVLGDAGHFVLTQQWHDQAAFDRHYASPAFATFQRDLEVLLSRQSEMRVYHVEAAHQLLAPDPLDPRRAD